MDNHASVSVANITLLFCFIDWANLGMMTAMQQSQNAAVSEPQVTPKAAKLCRIVSHQMCFLALVLCCSVGWSNDLQDPATAHVVCSLKKTMVKKTLLTVSTAGLLKYTCILFAIVYDLIISLFDVRTDQCWRWYVALTFHHKIQHMVKQLWLWWKSTVST